jgi:Protein of unknown function (DUF4239)
VRIGRAECDRPPPLAVIVRVLILWGVIALAAVLSVLVHQRRTSDEPANYQVVLGFFGAAYGLLLGLLVVFAVGHYSDVRHEAEREASSLVALYDAVSVYPARTKEPIRHDLICYMRSIVADEWPSMERGNRTEAPRTGAFGDRVRRGTSNLPVNDERERTAYGRANSLIGDAGMSRQQLLFFTEPEIPNALWVVIYVGAFLLVLLLAGHYTGHPGGRVAALGSVTALLTVLVLVLVALDHPFGEGARVHPDEMRQAIELLSVSGEHNVGILRPCPATPQG